MITELIPSNIISTAQGLSTLFTAFALMYIGYSVEKDYTSRPALFANGTALLVYTLTHLIPNSATFEALVDPMTIAGETIYPAWAGLEIYVFGSIIVGLYGMVSYNTRRRNSVQFYDFAHFSLNSLAVGGIILSTFVLTIY